MVGAFAWHMRGAGIFACPATAYGENHYLGYCQGSAYGDYDHGAVWFGLEEGVREAAAAADVLFIGNSRLQFGFSAPALGEWFAEAGARYYLLGFSHNETARFTEPLLAGLEPRARAYVINVDKFFFKRESPPAASVMHEPGVRARYTAKRAWQEPHRLRLRGAARALRRRDRLLPPARHRRMELRRLERHRRRDRRRRPPRLAGGDPQEMAAVSENARGVRGLPRGPRGGAGLRDPDLRPLDREQPAARERHRPCARARADRAGRHRPRHHRRLASRPRERADLHHRLPRRGGPAPRAMPEGPPTAAG